MGLSPFDTEMRRRLWWQVVVLDVRSAEDFGTDPSIGEYTYDVQLPLNINDSQLDPSDTEFPEPHEGVSELTFCLIRYEIANAARRLAYIPPTGPCLIRAQKFSLEDKEQMLRELQDRLENIYLKHCDSAGPLFWVAATVARLVLSKMSLIIYGFHQTGTVDTLPQHIKDRLFIASIEIMEYSQLLQTEATTKKWGWLFHTYTQWHAMAYILREVCVRPHSPGVERGWLAVDNVFSSWGDVVKVSKGGPLWTPMRRLMLKARRKRQADMRAMELEQRQRDDQTQSESPGLCGLQSINVQQELASGTTHLRQEMLLPGYWHPPNPPEQNGDSMTGYMAGSGVAQTKTTANNNAGLAGQVDGNVAVPWLLDDSALLDLDMGAVDMDGEISWEGWDDVVRDFQMEVDMSQPEARGPNINSMGAWW